MRSLLAFMLTLLVSPSYAEYDCKSAAAEMAKALAVMSQTAEEAGAIDKKTLTIYEIASNKFFSCQKSQEWTLAVASGKTPQIVATEGKATPQH